MQLGERLVFAQGGSAKASVRPTLSPNVAPPRSSSARRRVRFIGSHRDGAQSLTCSAPIASL